LPRGGAQLKRGGEEKEGVHAGSMASRGVDLQTRVSYK
jgi:hypothetical protein